MTLKKFSLVLNDYLKYIIQTYYYQLYLNMTYKQEGDKSIFKIWQESKKHFHLT